MIEFNENENYIKRYFARLSPVREDPQEEDEQNLTDARPQLDLAEYDIIELAEDHVHEETSLNILSIMDVFRENLAYLTGGTSIECPILTFPDNPQIELTQEKYRKLVSYLTQVPSENERQLGFVLIIDRRSDRWMAVKSLIGYIENYFPYAIQCIYLLRPNSWMQRALSHLTVFNDLTCSYRLIICRTLLELHQYCEPSQLSKDLGGLIDFRLCQWIEQRATIEKFTQSIHEYSAMLFEFMKQCNEIEFPNNAESTQRILDQTFIQKKELEQELRRLKMWGHSLLCVIRQEHKQSSSSDNHILDKSNDIHHLILSPDQSAHARACINALTHIDRAEFTLSQFWPVHKRRLNHCLLLRNFEQRFKEIQCIFLQLHNELTQLPNITTTLLLSDYCRFDSNNNNNCKEEIAQTLIQLDDLSQRTQTMISHATLLANDGLALVVEQQKQQSMSYGIDSIEPKRQELEEMKKKLIEQIDEKRHNLKLLKIYIDKLGSINDWCLRGKDMLAMHSTQLSNDKILRSLTEFEHFLTDLSRLNIEELQEKSAPEPLRSMIIQLLNRVNDVQDLCEKRCEQFRHLVKPMHRPVQRVHPLPLPQNEAFNLIGTASTMSPVALQQQQQQQQLLLSNEHTDRDLSRSSHESAINHNVKMDKRQRHVVTELLVTEQLYVEELRTIISGYMNKFDDPDHYRHLPPIILQNKSTLFSNLPDIYTFHATSFLRDLQQIYDDPVLINTCSIGSAIASCFIKRKSNFKLYEQYVLNKSQSERIWEQYCLGHPFFTKMQQSVGHRLPLDSYLLKPIQRITQYQLLLKEMIKYTRFEQECANLQEALDVMLNVLSYLNDVMHSTQIVGYPDNTNTLGQIRLRAESCLISKEKRRGTVYTRTKTSTRDIFLFERMILLCKKKDEGNGKSIQYQFKELIKITDIAVCTHPRNDRKKFEIVLKDYSYIIQLSTSGDMLEEMSVRWIDTIRHCVSQQTEQRRAEIKHRSSSLDHSSQARRRFSNRKTVPIRIPESEDEKIHSPITFIDTTLDVIKPPKLSMNNSISHL